MIIFSGSAMFEGFITSMTRADAREERERERVMLFQE